MITKKAFEDYYNTEKVVGKGDLGTSYVVTELANPLNYYLMKEIEDINLV